MKVFNRALRTVKKYYPHIVEEDSEVKLKFDCRTTSDNKQFVHEVSLTVDAENEFKLVVTTSTKKDDNWLVTELNKLIRSSVGSV